MHANRPLWAGLALAGVFVSPAARAERPHIYALTGGTVVASPDQTLPKGTVVLRDGLIEAVGTDVAPPSDAEIIDATGLYLYPGLVEPAADCFPRRFPSPDCQETEKRESICRGEGTYRQGETG